MSDTKHTHGLQLVSATRVSVSNTNPNEHSITVNNRQLSFRDIDLGGLKLTDDNKVLALDKADNVYYEVLHTNSDFQAQLEEEDDAGEPVGSKLLEGQIIPSGNSLFKQASPAPFAYIDTSGRLGSANMWSSLFVANVMGYVDVDKATNTYNHGLCPAGSATHGGLFLRKDGQWGQPSPYTGSVADTLLSLQDTPSDYTNQLDKYLRVSYDSGGGVVFDAINTDKVPEASSNLYYTDARVDARMAAKLQDKSIQNIAVSGTITANEVLAESDLRLKQDVFDLCSEQCKQAVDMLKPKSYAFKSDLHKRLRYGLIAQDVEQVLPSLVSTNEQGTMSVNYMELVPLLIGTVHALRDEMEALKNDLHIVQRDLKYIR